MIFDVKKFESGVVITIQVEEFRPEYCLLINRAIIKMIKFGAKNIIINLNQNISLNNLFIENLLFTRRYCNRFNGTIAVCGIKPDVLGIFYLLNLDKYFEFYENELDAVNRANRLIKRKLKLLNNY